MHTIHVMGTLIKNNLTEIQSALIGHNYQSGRFWNAVITACRFFAAIFIIIILTARGKPRGIRLPDSVYLLQVSYPAPQSW